MRFTAPLHLGDTVILSGSITSVEDGVAHLDLAATGFSSTLVTGTALVAVD